VKTKLDNYLHKNPPTAEALLRKILQAERERKELSGIRKLATDRAKKANHNKKLRDCPAHLPDTKILGFRKYAFITEGDRLLVPLPNKNVNTQAVLVCVKP
jgi:topoisomerase-4 subunit B